jgi:AraC-like DNA-binding protein
MKKATGVTFSEYLSRARLERAKSLLLDPNVRVSEAAFEAGFQSLTHFNRVFKNLIGTSPSEFRKQGTTG